MNHATALPTSAATARRRRLPRPTLALHAVVAACALLAAGASPAQLIEWNPKPWPKIVPPAPDDLVAITAGMNHTCVQRYDGGVLCWGDNTSGQTGTANSRNCGYVTCVTVPTRVATDVNGRAFSANRLSAGANHTCSLDARGNAFCWGLNSDGQTGVPSLAQVWQPTPVAGGQIFVGIGAGIAATCAVEQGATWCWGAAGGITGSGFSSVAPQAVPRSANYQAVAVGMQHACMQTNVWGWNEVNCNGGNSWGQTTTDPAFFPVLPTTFGTTFGRPVGPPTTRVVYTCADRLFDGTVACAGDNTYGMLGDGTNQASFNPVVVGNGQKLAGVTAGWFHACAIDPQQQAWCWGWGGAGQLGNVASFTSWRPVLVGNGAVKFRALAAGYMHTCGIGTDNLVYCWGNNSRAQLGLNDSKGWTDRPLYTVPLPRG
jgi:alpha-tubulin suppressor-like RCC1 family protein